MKSTAQKKEKNGLLSRSEQSGFEGRPEIDFDLRRANRALETEKLLALLRSDAPRFFEIAEVVGKWVWIQFSDKQPPTITSVLAELGFHWNNTRQAWQHPCGRSAGSGRRSTLASVTGATSPQMRIPPKKSQ